VGGTLNSYTLLTLMYIAGTGFTLYKLMHSWRAFWGDSPDLDVRQLATWTALFLMVPVAVLIHGLGQMAVASMLGQEIYGLDYSLYTINVRRSWGSPEQDWYVALAGNAASYGLGVVSIAAGTFWKKLRRPMRLVVADLGS
jgi:hypothetical protein